MSLFEVVEVSPDAYKFESLLESRFGLFGASFFLVFVVHPFWKGGHIESQGAQMYTKPEIEIQLESDQGNCQAICATIKYHRAHLSKAKHYALPCIKETLQHGKVNWHAFKLMKIPISIFFFLL